MGRGRQSRLVENSGQCNSFDSIFEAIHDIFTRHQVKFHIDVWITCAIHTSCSAFFLMHLPCDI